MVLPKRRQRLGGGEPLGQLRLDEQVRPLLGERQVEFGAALQLQALDERAQRRDERDGTTWDPGRPLLDR